MSLINAHKAGHIHRQHDDWDEVHNQLLAIQKKSLEVSNPNDADEKEADAVARKVVDGQSAQIHGTGGTINRKGEGSFETTPEFQSRLENSKGSGQSLDDSTRNEMESKMGADFSGVKIHTGSEAHTMNENVNAKAFAHENNIYFKHGEFNTEAKQGKELLAHELAHTVQQSGNKIQPKIQRQPKDESFPFVGYIKTDWTVALRSKPAIDKANPHNNTDYDLPNGTEVTVLSSQNGFYYVKTKAPDGHKQGIKTGGIVYGYVSHELVNKQAEELVEFDKDLMKADVLTLDDSLLIMTSAKRLKVNKHKFTSYEMEKISKGKTIIEQSGKYTVNDASYEVTFKTSKDKITINTIEDFILFVEDVERQYPSATAIEVASEIRQMWYADENWDVLLASQGIKDVSGGKTTYINIESEPDPIAKKYKIADLAPRTGSKNLSTKNGTVDIGHVMAGIDATLSGFPAAYPEQFVKDRMQGKSTLSQLKTTIKEPIKYATFATVTGGVVGDFATWSGDIGQSYGTYMAEKNYGKPKATFATYSNNYCSDAALLGDLNGFIMKSFWDNLPSDKSPSNKEMKVSQILASFYLSNKASMGVELSYEKLFMKAANLTDASQIEDYILKRSLGVAEIFYLQGVLDAGGYNLIGAPKDDRKPLDIIKEFFTKHIDQEKNAADSEKIEVLVKKLKNLLSGSLK